MKFTLFLFFAFVFCSSILLGQTDTSTTETDDSDFLINSPNEETESLYINYLFDNAGSDTKGENAYVALLRLVEKYISVREYDEAITFMTQFKGDFKPPIQKKIDKTIEILKRKLENLIDVNLGSGINSEGSEYSPIPTADDEVMFYTGLNRDKNNASEDIFRSVRGADGVWRTAGKLDESINSDNQGEAPQSISTDGNLLILFGAYKQHLGKGDLYYTEKTSEGRWSEVTPYPRPVNSEYFDCDAKLTPDGKAMLFVSDRPGGIGDYHPYSTPFHGSKNGNTDIYVSVLSDSGWSEAINLGKNINTPYSERKPFLHPDGKSLYFASDGHPGIGRLDLYKSKKIKEDSWVDWAEPVNMGKEVNTIYDDRGAIVTTMGDLAYFASAERPISFGGSDIYSMDMPASLRPEPVATLQGTVTDNEGNHLDAYIVWEDLTTGKKLGRLKTDPTNGKYFVVLPLGKNYGIYAEKEGYFPISKNFDLKKVNKTSKKTEDFVMYSLEDLLGDDLETTGSGDLIYDAFELKKDKKIVMNNLFFDYNKWNLLNESHSELDRVVYLLKNFPIELVEISGHTDSVGKDEYNLELSDKRANSVVQYLTKKGVPNEKLQSKGYGKEQPVASNETDEGRAKNRRVELNILKSRSIMKKQE